MSGNGRPQAGSYGVGDWCRTIDRLSIWNETVLQVWLPTRDAIIRARKSDLAPLATLRPTENEIRAVNCVPALELRADGSRSQIVAIQ